ncbi:MAG: FtsX-like permease family protein [Clostridia bacterium]|nr:FtsX-like permease family protein [Clostridia bacterium]
MKKMDLMLWRMIKHSRAQFIAVLLIITVGIAIFTAMSLAGINLDDSKEQYYKENAFADLNISVQKLPASLIGDFQNIDGIAFAEGRIAVEVPFIGEEDERVNVKLVSVPSKGQTINKLLIKEGRFIKDPNEEVIILSQFAEARNIKIGDNIVFQVSGTRCELEVVGIAYSPEFVYLIESVQSMMPAAESYGVIYVNESLLMQLAGMTGAYNEVFFLYEEGIKDYTQKGFNEDDIIDAVEKIAKPYGLIYTTERENQLSNSLIKAEIDQLKKSGFALPMVFLLVAALVIAMMVSRMVKKDRIKIGVMKAIGYSNLSVLGHYVKYSIAAGFVGGVFGILLGYRLAGSMTSLYADFFEIPQYGMKIYWEYILGGVLLSCLFCTVFGVYGAKTVFHIVPAESMQSEAPKEGKRILLEAFPWFWKKLSFSRKLTIKNIFRNKKRSLFVLFGVSLTFSTIIFTTTMPEVIDDMMVKQFQEVQTMDYNVSFITPVPMSSARDLSYEISEDSYVEGRIEYPFELSVGNKIKSVTVIGIKEDSQVLHLKNILDEEIYPQEGGILLTQNLANALDVSKGQTIRAESYISGGKDCYLIVQDIVKQTMGMNAYMDVDYMGEALLEHGAITGVYINTEDEDIVSILRQMDNVSTVFSSSEMANMYTEYMGLTLIMLSMMVVFSGILGFTVVYNATIVSLSERKMEFSSLRVMGFGKDEIFKMIVAENIMISIVGFIVGLPLGYGLSAYSSVIFTTDLYTLYMSPTTFSILVSLLLTILFVLIAQFATYEKIRKLDFLQALKNRTS